MTTRRRMDGRRALTKKAGQNGNRTENEPVGRRDETGNHNEKAAGGGNEGGGNEKR